MSTHLPFENIHIFNDPSGYYSGSAKRSVDAISPGNNVFLNTSVLCKTHIDGIYYKPVKEFLEEKDLALKRVIFHSYSYHDTKALHLLKSKYKDAVFIWIFWSHEYYQLPEFFDTLYQGFSRRYLLRKRVTFHIEQFRSFLRGKAGSPLYMGLKKFRKSFENFHAFGAFLEGDYENVMEANNKTGFLFFSYLTLADFPERNENEFSDGKDIMVGHSGSPICNHYEIVKELTALKLNNKINLPLAYGKKEYIHKLSQAIHELGNPHVTLIRDFIPKEKYYESLERVGFFILNASCQQALGNIVYFLWIGTKIFLQKETSTYKTLKKLSFHVYSIENDLTEAGLVTLSLNEKKHNQELIKKMISEEHVQNQWLKILHYNQQTEKTMLNV